MWDFAFPVAPFPRPGFPWLPQISKFARNSAYTANHRLLIFAPIHLLPFSSHKPMKMGGQFALLDFPVEIICHILSFVSYRDLIHSTLGMHSLNHHT
jgi:hypothetical protein